MKFIEKLIATFLLIMGISIISVWLMLIMTRNVHIIREEITGFVFHWISELLLAILSIILFFALISSKDWVKKAIFFDLGLAVCSTIHAVSYYYFRDFNIVMIWFIGFFLIGSILSFIYYFKTVAVTNPLSGNRIKFGLFSIGITVYLLLNIAGEYGQKGEWVAFSNLIFIIMIGIYYTLYLIRKDYSISN